MTEIEISSGRLTSLARLLVFLSNNPEVDAFLACENLVQISQVPSQKLATEVLQVATTLDLISDLGGIWQLSQSGRSIVLGSKDEFGFALQRRLLLKIILKSRRDLLWVAFAEPEELRSITPALHQILSELQLLNLKQSSEAESFWDDLRRAESRFNDVVLKKIGDQAEAWSMSFESQRLRNLGRPDLANDVTWVSRESDLHGYDILSFSGSENEPRDRRHIEVKRTRVVSSNFVEFYLSENEYRQSMVFAEKYQFHLWWIDAISKSVSLSICPSSTVYDLVPKNVDSYNHWTECVVRYDLARATSTHVAPDDFSLDL
jgi:hypothetical protein